MSDDPLLPPVDVAKPKPSPAVPFANRPPGAIQWSIKADGWRLVVFNLADGVVLQTKGGRNIASDHPDVVQAALRLPVGTVVDGELAAVKDGRFAFHALGGGKAARRRAGVTVSFLAFDVLAVEGRDVCRLPLAERWDLLQPLVDEAGPPFELILATLDRDEAIEWMHALGPMGVEGLVAKPMDGKYVGGTSGGWVKYRRRDTVDATVTGTVGLATRPSALRLELADGRTLFTNTLTALQARAVDAAIAAAGGVDGLVVEIRLGHGRHGTATFVRVRGE